MKDETPRPVAQVTGNGQVHMSGNFGCWSYNGIHESKRPFDVVDLNILLVPFDRSFWSYLRLSETKADEAVLSCLD